MNEILVSYRMNLGMVKTYLSDVSAERMAEMPAGLNPPVWIVGHLCVASDRLLGMLGGTPSCPDTYVGLFGKGSEPTDDLAAYPSKDELLGQRDKLATQLMLACESASEELLASENPMEMLRTPLPTVGDLVAFMLTSHEAMHAGQLSAWRRASGFKPLF